MKDQSGTTNKKITKGQEKQERWYPWLRTSTTATERPGLKNQKKKEQALLL